MSDGDLRAFARRIGDAVSRTSSSAATDRELLARFADVRDEAAFAVLLGRYGRLVSNVCRNVLGHEHDAEDAAQATFLVLARRATSLGHLGVLAGWLHGVAYRTALRARRDAGRRRAREAREQPARAAPPAGPLAEAAWREFRAILDEELQRLPERLRTPFALCCLEGCGYGEAARRLGWKAGTVGSRLDEARKLLRRRLARRGVSLPAVLGGLTLTVGKARSSLAGTRAAETVAAARRFVDGGEPGLAGKLAAAVLREARWARAKFTMIAAALAGALVVDVGMSVRRPAAPAPGPEPVAVSPPSPEAPDPPRVDRFGDALPAGAIARLGTARFGHDWYTESTVWSPDGKIIASLNGNTSARPLCLWDAATGRELHRLAAEAAFSAAFSPDGKTLAVAEGKRGIVLWNVGSGKELGRFTGQGDGVAVAFAPDGRTLAAAGRAGVIQVREVTGGRLAVELKASDDQPPKRVAYSPDGKTLASTGNDGAVILWDPRTGRKLWSRKPHGDWAFGLAFAPDGKAFATTGADGVIRIWDTSSGESLCSVGNAVQNASYGDAVPNGMLIAYAPDGRTLASPGPGDFVCLWDPSTGKEIRRWHTGEEWLQSVSYSKDGRTLATTGFCGSRVRLWDPQTGTELRAPVGHNALIFGLAFSPDAKTVWSAGRDKAVIRWDVASGQGQRLPEVQGYGYGHTVAFSSAGQTVATGGIDGSIRLWDASGHSLGTLTGHTGGIVTVAFSPDGKILASSSADNDDPVRFWDVANNRELRKALVTRGSWGCLAFSADGRKLALARGQVPSKHPDAVVLDVLTGKENLRLEFPSPAAGVPAPVEQFVTISPDGRTLATTGRSQDTVLRLWDAATGELIGRCGGEVKCRLWSCLSFSPDGRLLAAGPYDHDDTVHLWEVATCQEVARLRGHRGGITALAFSRDGRFLASAAGEAAVLVWDLTGRSASDQRHAGQLSLSELQECWKDLRSEDAATAYRAVRALAADPGRSVRFLAGRLQPTEPADHARLAPDTFAGRGRVEKLGGAIPPLVEPREGEAFAEDRRRAEGPPENPAAAPEGLRERRAVMALEYAATPEARQLLNGLAAPEVETRLAEHARMALARLSSRP